MPVSLTVANGRQESIHSSFISVENPVEGYGIQVCMLILRIFLSQFSVTMNDTAGAKGRFRSTHCLGSAWSCQVLSVIAGTGF